MSSTGDSINLMGYVFTKLDHMEHVVVLDTTESLWSFFMCYVSDAYEQKKSAAITNDEDEVVFYMQKGRLVFPSDMVERLENLMKIITGEK